MKKILGLLLILSSSVFAREITLDQAIQIEKLLWIKLFKWL